MQAFYLDTVDSTNDVGRSMLREGKIHDAAYIVARRQTAGRGHRGRTWLSPLDAGIYLTVVDRPYWEVGGELHIFTRAAAIACVETLFNHAQVQARLKPINDIYVEGCKLAGILTEAVIEQGALHALITGVGINVRKADRPLPPDHVRPVCLEELMSEKAFAALDLYAMVNDLVQRIRHWNAMVSQGDLRVLETEWQRYALSDYPPNTSLPGVPVPPSSHS